MVLRGNETGCNFSGYHTGLAELGISENEAIAVVMAAFCGDHRCIQEGTCCLRWTTTRLPLHCGQGLVVIRM